MSDNRSYSIQLRVRRTTYEDAYVSVPVVGGIVKPDAQGIGRIDIEAFNAEALRLAGDPRVEWRVESTEVAPHPLQGPRPEDRQTLDGWYDLPESREG